MELFTPLQMIPKVEILCLQKLSDLVFWILNVLLCPCWLTQSVVQTLLRASTGLQRGPAVTWRGHRSP